MPTRHRRPLTGLIVLNVALLIALGAVALAPKVSAQNRMRGTYSMVAGSVNGQITPVIYVVDENAQELVALSWDDNKKQLTGMGYRNLANDVTEIGRTRN